MSKKRLDLIIVLIILTTLGNGKGIPGDKGAIDWYETFEKMPPHPNMQVEMSRDSEIFTELNIPAILAILNHELSEGNWQELQSDDRKRILDILNDPNLVFIYTGKQSVVAHSSGAQTIDKITVKFNQDGWFHLGSPMSYHRIAKHILHELAHVDQERNNYFGRPLNTKEWWPDELENMLPEEKFTAEQVTNMADFLSKYSNLQGSWIGCDGRVVEFKLEGSEYVGRYTSLANLGDYGFKLNEVGYSATRTTEGTYKGKVKWRYTSGKQHWVNMTITVTGDSYSDTGSDHCSRNMTRKITD